MTFDFKRGLLIGTGVGLATIGCATVLPLSLIGVFGAFGACNGVGFGTAGVTAALATYFGGQLGAAKEESTAEELATSRRREDVHVDLMEELQRTITELRARADERAAHDADLLRLVRVLVGAARADGGINQIEIGCIRRMVFSSTYVDYPKEAKSRVEEALLEPIKLKAASRAFDEIASDRLRGLVRTLLDVVMASDAGSAPLDLREVGWLAAWDELTGDEPSAAA